MTRRSYATLQANLPDNTTGLILPTNVRDVVESYSQLRVVATRPSAAYTINTVGSAVNIPLTAAPGSSTGMTIVGDAFLFPVTGRFQITYKVTINTIAAAKALTLSLYSGGTLLNFSEVLTDVANGKSITLSGIYTVNTTATTQDVSMRISCDTSSTTCTSMTAFITASSAPVGAP